jgi:hypothetical protein
MPTEYDYERECNEIDEANNKQKDKLVEYTYDAFMERLKIERDKTRKETFEEVEKMIKHIFNQIPKGECNTIIYSELERLQFKLKEKKE